MSETQDTSAEALEAQRKVFRRMTGSQRLAMAGRLSDEARTLARDGARHREQLAAERSARRD